MQHLFKTYCIDTSALIDLHKYYPRKEPAFRAIWEEIERLIDKGSMFTIDVVEEEINDYQGRDDFLKRWLKEHKKKFVIKFIALNQKGGI